MSHRLVLSYTPIFLHPYLFLTLLTRQAGFTIAYTRKAAIMAYLSTVITRQASIAAKWPKRLVVKFFVWSCFNGYCMVMYHLYSASCSAHQSEALPVQKTQGEESSLERTKRVSKVDRVEGRSWFV